MAKNLFRHRQSHHQMPTNRQVASEKFGIHVGDEVQFLFEDKKFHVCTGWQGNTLPEDVGGEGGYEEFLEAYNDPSHEEHENMVNWARSQWYRDFNVDLTNRRLKNVLKRRS